MEDIKVLGGRVRLYQPSKGFRTSLDSVMCAAALPSDLPKAARVLDLGCGVGGAAFCALWRFPDSWVTGIDIVPDFLELARLNAGLNDFQDRIDFIQDDVISYTKALEKPVFDAVICNPPFYEKGSYIRSPQPLKDTALGYAESQNGLEGWVKSALYALRPGGIFCLVHRAETLDKILQAFGTRFGAVEVMPLWPKKGEPARRVVLRCIKGRKSPLTLHPGICLHTQSGAYTKKAEAILRDADPLFPK